MFNTYKVIILLKDGTEIKDSCRLMEKSMEKYVEYRMNVFKGLLVSDSFAISKDEIKMMFFEDEAKVNKEEK